MYKSLKTTISHKWLSATPISHNNVKENEPCGVIRFDFSLSLSLSLSLSRSPFYCWKMCWKCFLSLVFRSHCFILLLSATNGQRCSYVLIQLMEPHILSLVFTTMFIYDYYHYYSTLDFSKPIARLSRSLLTFLSRLSSQRRSWRFSHAPVSLAPQWLYSF